MSAKADAQGSGGLSAVSIAALGLVVGVGSVTTDMYFPAMPSLQRELAVDAAAVQATLSVYLVGLAAGQLLFGPVSDRLGRRVPMLGGLLLYVVGSLLAAAAQDLWSLLGARFLQAAGAAAGLVVARAMVTDRYRGQAAARLQSLLTQILAIASIGAPVVGGWLVTVSDWRTIFVVLAVLGAGAALVAASCLRETLPPAHRSRGGLGANVRAWRGLLADRGYVLFVLTASFPMAAIYALILGSTFVLIDGYGWSPGEYGLFYALTSVVFVVAGWLNDRALRRWQAAAILSVTLPAMTLAAAAMFAAALAGLFSAALLVAGMAAIMALLAFIYGNIVAVTMERARDRAGLGAGLLGATQYAVSSLVAAAGGLFDDPILAMAGATVLFMLPAVPCYWLALSHRRASR